MAPARCPVCNDIINIGISVRLYQGIICPTCLTRISVVSLEPLELELPSESSYQFQGIHNRSGNKRQVHNEKRSRKPGTVGVIEDMEFMDEDFDDYLIERRQRNKKSHERQRRTNST